MLNTLSLLTQQVIILRLLGLMGLGVFQFLKEISAKQEAIIE